MSVFFLVVGILLIAMSLLIIFINPILGVIILVFGVLLIVFRKKFKTNKTIEAEKEQARIAEHEEKRQQKETAQRAENEKLSLIPQCIIDLSAEPKKRNIVYPNPTFSNISAKGHFLDFVVFDTETTGLAPSRDRIIELAAVKFKDGLPIETFHTYVNPEREIPEKASSINHIYDKDVADAPVIGSVIESFDTFVGDNILVAHNLDFDLKFIYYSGSNILNQKICLIDTFEQAKRLLKSPKVKYDSESDSYEKDFSSNYDVIDYKLDTLCNYYHLVIAKQHSALADAYATGKLFLRLVSEKQALPQNILDFLKN